MSANSTNHPTDWEAQRERLSAYLDGRLPAPERIALDQHLPTCARCANELAELRRTVAVLRALPTPALPRSFALPIQPRVATVGTTRRATSRPAPRWAAAAQWAGGLAAAAGLILVLGSALGGALQVTDRAASNGSAGGTTAAAPYNPTGHLANGTPTHNSSAYPTTAASTPLPTCVTTVTPSGTRTTICNETQAGATTAPMAIPTSSGHQPASFGAEHTTATTGSPPVLPLTGGGLAVGGLVVFAVGRRARRPARQRGA
jgi:hypothetical protein